MENGKLIDLVEKIFLENFAQHFGGHTEYQKEVEDIKQKYNLVEESSIEIENTSEKVLFKTFLEIKSCQKYDLKLLIDCILNVCRKYISDEAVKFIHGNIGKITNDLR